MPPEDYYSQGERRAVPRMDSRIYVQGGSSYEEPVPESGMKDLEKSHYVAIETVIDLVNHPAHYKDGGIEVIDYIEAKKLNYNLGNAVKYISRAGKKEGVSKQQDLEKARWYLAREISHGT